MLVLTRKVGEQLVVGDGIVVTVTEVRGNRIRLAFDAPPEVSIHRRELRDKLTADSADERSHAG